MRTNHLMLKDLKEKFHPQQRGIITMDEYWLIKETLHLEEMDVLALRNLRYFVVASMSHSDNAEDLDRISAITYVIDEHIVDLGGEV